MHLDAPCELVSHLDSCTRARKYRRYIPSAPCSSSSSPAAAAAAAVKTRVVAACCSSYPTPPAPGSVVALAKRTAAPPVGESSAAAAPVLRLSLDSPSPQQRDIFAPFGAVVSGVAESSLRQGAKAETVDVPQAASVAVGVTEAPGAIGLAAV